MSSFLATITSVSTGDQAVVIVTPIASAASPGNELPGGPVHPWLPGMGRPDRPDNTLPGSGARPDNTLPPLPPDAAHPGNPIVLPPEISNGLPIHPVTPDNSLPGVPPGTIYPPLPPNVPRGKAVVLVAISGVGYRWAVIDTSLSAGMPLPTPPPPTAGTPLPPAAQPKAI